MCVYWCKKSGCDPHAKVFFLKVIQSDMEMKQCHRFLHSWQDTELVPCTHFLRMKPWTPHDLK